MMNESANLNMPAPTRLDRGGSNFIHTADVYQADIRWNCWVDFIAVDRGDFAVALRKNLSGTALAVTRRFD